MKPGWLTDLMNYCDDPLEQIREWVEEEKMNAEEFKTAIMYLTINGRI